MGLGIKAATFLKQLRARRGMVSGKSTYEVVSSTGGKTKRRLWGRPKLSTAKKVSDGEMKLDRGHIKKYRPVLKGGGRF